MESNTFRMAKEKADGAADSRPISIASLLAEMPGTADPSAYGKLIESKKLAILRLKEITEEIKQIQCTDSLAKLEEERTQCRYIIIESTERLFMIMELTESRIKELDQEMQQPFIDLLLLSEMLQQQTKYRVIASSIREQLDIK
jgi:hypothetical protein